MTYVLLVVSLSFGFSADFSSQKACEAAIVELKPAIAKATVKCLPKGADPGVIATERP
jgi:hypothetical protein